MIVFDADCSQCGHPKHGKRVCDHAITKDVRDVGWIVRTLLVENCRCVAWYDS